MKKIGFISLLVIAILAVISYNYLYQDHRDVAASEAVESFSTSELIKLFTDADSKNDLKALDQVIALTGSVTQVNEGQIIMDDQIFVEIEDFTGVEVQQQITIKGRCLGYDDLMGEVKIDQATMQ